MSLEADAGKEIDKLLIVIPKPSKTTPVQGEDSILSILMPIKDELQLVQRTSLVIRQAKLKKVLTKEIAHYDTELRKKGLCFPDRTY